MSYKKTIDVYNQIYRKVDLSTILEMWASNCGGLNVYVHSPFCASICRFCYYKGVQFDFESDADIYERFYSEYLPGSVRPFLPMLESRDLGNYFFGGGTPSLMRPDTMRSVFNLFPRFKEVKSKTFEIHPAVWSEEQIDILAENKFNCCIIGIQSFDEKVLERQKRLHAPFERVLELANCIRERGMYLAVDLIYRMDQIDADEIFERDVELVGKLGSDVISLQLNYDEITNQECTEKFFKMIFDSELADNYYWEGGGQISINRKKTLKCFRCVKNGIPNETYATEIFPFIATIDEASKIVGHDSQFPSVIGFGSYQNPRKNTFSNVRNETSTVEYIEVDNDWNHEYYITYEAQSRDFFDECIKELNVIREIGPPPLGLKIILGNKTATSKENYIYRKIDSLVDMSVGWDYGSPEIEKYVSKLKELFPHWVWDIES